MTKAELLNFHGEKDPNTDWDKFEKEEYKNFLKKFFEETFKVAKNNAIMFVFCAPTKIESVLFLTVFIIAFGVIFDSAVLTLVVKLFMLFAFVAVFLSTSSTFILILSAFWSIVDILLLTFDSKAFTFLVLMLSKDL